MFPESAIPADATLDPADIAREIVACVTGETDLDNGATKYVVK